MNKISLHSTLVIFSLLCLTLGIFSCDKESLQEKSQKVFFKTYGGLGSEEGNDIVIANDGGFLLVGSTTSFGSGERDVFLVKTDEYGNETWKHHYGNSEEETGISLIQESGGDIIIAGHRKYILGYNVIFVMRVSADGILMDEREFPQYTISNSGDTTVNDEIATDIQVIGNGIGFLILGTNKTQKLITALEIGNDFEYKRMGRRLLGQVEYNNIGKKAIVLSNDEFALFGTSDFVYQNQSELDRLNFYAGLKRFEESDLIQGQRGYGTTHDDYGMCFSQTVDNGYIMCGYTINNNIANVYVVKCDQRFVPQWDKDFKAEYNDKGIAVIQTQDLGFVVLKQTEIPGVVEEEFGLTKLNASGDIEWERTLGSQGDDYAAKIIELHDGSLALIGKVNYNLGSAVAQNTKMCLVKLNNSGELIVEK